MLNVSAITDVWDPWKFETIMVVMIDSRGGFESYVIYRGWVFVREGNIMCFVN